MEVKVTYSPMKSRLSPAPPHATTRPRSEPARVVAFHDGIIENCSPVGHQHGRDKLPRAKLVVWCAVRCQNTVNRELVKALLLHPQHSSVTLPVVTGETWVECRLSVTQRARPSKSHLGQPHAPGVHPFGRGETVTSESQRQTAVEAAHSYVAGPRTCNDSHLILQQPPTITNNCQLLCSRGSG